MLVSEQQVDELDLEEVHYVRRQLLPAELVLQLRVNVEHELQVLE